MKTGNTGTQTPAANAAIRKKGYAFGSLRGGRSCGSRIGLAAWIAAKQLPAVELVHHT